MKISEKIRQADHPLVSVEFFPPKTEEARRAFQKTAEELVALKPDYVSVTCGAGGSVSGPTLDVSVQLHDAGFGTVMPHCTCAGMSRDALERSVEKLVDCGFQNIMALRGDPPSGTRTFTPEPGGFRYASGLVKRLRFLYPDLCIGAAGYPETHPEAGSPEEDIQHLKEKTEAGADFIMTQLFLDNHVYFKFIEKCRDTGIRVPIIPGIFPVLSLAQVNRMKTFCDFGVPERLRRRLEAAQNNPEESERIGLSWAVNQISELAAAGVPGIHLYLLNRSRTAFYPELFACLARIRNG